ncbi:MAG TPA: sulfotransferase, partial [Nocardioides sp.]|nr:sulfotransferase [Nocardioides sp.]
MPRPERPDFLIIGAPKAGTTALHSALAQHPDVFTTTPKEPKYWLCGDAPPPHWTGPGDAHSQQEWIWRRRDYDALFRSAGEHQVRGESTPFYLWSYPAHRRISEHLPEVKLIAVVRDPIDRAYSNWMHLWSDGLEREPDFERAFFRQRDRIDAGWAPFWRYRDLGLYGRQLEHLYRYVDRERVLVVRYKDIVEAPGPTVDRVCDFLGIPGSQVAEIPRDNSRHYAEPGWRTAVFA